MLYQIALYVLEKRGELDNYQAWKESLASLPKALRKVREEESRSEEFVNFIQEGPMIMMTGSGVNYGEAYMFSMCILQEMQWIPAQWIHAGEFFHGAFEILVEDTPLLVLHGEDKTRPLSQRVIDFASNITKRLFVIDAKDYTLDGVKAEHRGFLNPFIFMAVLGRLGDDLAEARNHPLTTRRYMGKVKY
jgi:fructoselysine-6-P-deglycase FrlB-like protein